MSLEFEIVRAGSDAEFAAAGTLGVRLVRYHYDLDPVRFTLINGTDDDYAAVLKAQSENNQRTLLLLARCKADQRTVGYIFGEFQEQEVNGVRTGCAHLHELYVDDSARQSGVAKALLTSLNAHMGKLGAPRVILLVANNNHAARALFSSAGFVPTMIEMTCVLP